jgi:hypothetical protein
MGRFGMVGGCYPQIPPKKPSKFSTVRPVVAELKRRGVEIQLRTTENVPLGGVKLGGFLGVTSDYPMFLSWLKIGMIGMIPTPERWEFNHSTNKIWGDLGMEPHSNKI